MLQFTQMKVLHYSDKGVKNILDLYNECDIFITTGDLRFVDFVGIGQLQFKVPSFGVYGNHDDGCSYLLDNNIENVHNKVVNFNGLILGGFQGCLRYNTREIQYTEDEAKTFYENFPYVDILILHAGPFGLLDDQSDVVHTGSKYIRKYVDDKKPKFVFCGHQYSEAEMTYGTTKIFRTYGARTIDINL